MEEHYGTLAGVFLAGKQVGLLRRWKMVIERKTTATAGSLIRSRATGWTATARVWKINVEAEEYEFRFAETANYYQVWGKITKKGKVLEMEGLPPIKAIFP